MGVLVLLSLVLITLSFRSSALDGVQGTAASVLRPFEIAANRVARPFRDAIGWAHGLSNAKSENKKLRREIQALQAKQIQDEGALQENVQLRTALNYRGPPSVADFDKVHTTVLANPQTPIDQSISIGAGSSNGVRAQDVVLSPSGGLVGVVDKVWSSVARVTLLTDPQSEVTATDLTSPGAVGLVSRGGSNSLVFDRVSKTKVVNVGDTVITEGSLGKGALPSMFPRGVLVGTVTSTSNSDINPFLTIQVAPAVDFTSLQSVIVLVPKR